MKCHYSRTLLSVLALSLAVNLVSCDSESDPDPTSGGPDLEAEHRGAKTEPFLDRIASFFGGGNDKKNKPNQVAPVYQRPGLQVIIINNCKAHYLVSFHKGAQ